MVLISISLFKNKFGFGCYLFLIKEKMTTEKTEAIISKPNQDPVPIVEEKTDTNEDMFQFYLRAQDAQYRKPKSI